jgi:acyl carrier protein
MARENSSGLCLQESQHGKSYGRDKETLIIGEQMSRDGNSINTRIHNFLLEKFPLAKKRDVKDSDELLESGVIDSLGILDLVNFLEEQFSITVVDDELVPENFRTVECMVAFVESRLTPKT